MRILAAQRIDWASIVLWLGLLAALIIAAGVAIWRIRRAIREAEENTAPAFTLQSLREMRDRGELTEGEFQAAREVALGEAGAGLKARERLSDSPRKGEAGR